MSVSMMAALCVLQSTPAPSAGVGAGQALAVLPMAIKWDDFKNREGSTLLTSALAARLAQQGDYRVIAADEVAELVQNEADRQGMGCTDSGCLAELAGAMGARFLVTGDITALGSTLLWSVSLVDQGSGDVVRRVSVRGETVQALLAQSDEVALALLGRARETQLVGRQAQKRLGFANAEDLARFRVYREHSAGLSTGEALTQFIVEHNLESGALAVAEGATLVGAATAQTLVMALGTGALFSLLTLRQPALALGLAGSAGCLGPLAVLLGAAGISMTLVDAFNLGRVKVNAKGCCRQDSDIRDAASSVGLQRALALAVMLAGPVQCASTLIILNVGALLGELLPRAGVGYAATSQASNGYYRTPLVLLAGPLVPMCYFFAFTGIIWPTCVGSVAGAFLLLWPTRPPLDGVEDLSWENGAASS